MCFSTLQKKSELNWLKIKGVRGVITILNQYDEQGKTFSMIISHCLSKYKTGTNKILLGNCYFGQKKIQMSNFSLENTFSEKICKLAGRR